MDDATASIPSSMSDLEPPLGGRPPQVAKLSVAELNEIATEQLDQPVSVTEEAAFELTARHPYDAAGSMDFFQPGRWDSQYDFVSMYEFVIGPDGLWHGDGTVGYINYTAATPGNHLVAVRFNGYQTTLRASGGPWGIATAYCATMADTATVTALWQANAGDLLTFELTSTPGDASIRAVQAFPLA